MTWVKRIGLGLATILGIAVTVLFVVVATRQDLRFNDTPYPHVRASHDPLVVEHGRYIVRNLGSCAGCHTPVEQTEALLRGDELALIGGRHWAIPPGDFYSRNLTSDPETGLGGVKDEAIARALRSGVGADGRALLPFMEMQGLSDDDLTAVVSYLRTLPAARNSVAANRYSLLGRIVKATVLSRPVGPRETPPTTAPVGATVERGRYLAEFVMNCYACHTQRSRRDGSLVGPRFAGARGFDFDGTPDRLWNPPNITAAPNTGRLAAYSEDDFAKRFRAGPVYPGSPMPWQAYQKVTEDDLRALYRYLKTVPAAERESGDPFEIRKKS